MRISTNTIFESGGSRISELQASLNRTQLQISSGRKILSPADDPIGSARALVLTQADAVNEQYATNRKYATNALSLAEDTLGNVTNVLHNVKTLMVSAGNGALSDQDRGYIANELQGNLDALFSMANTVDGTGEYLFAGFNTGNAPYTKTQGGAQYVGDQGTKTLQVDTSRQLPINEIGSNIFGNIQTSAGQFNVRPNPSNLGGGTATVAIDTATSGSLTGNNYEVTFDNTGANFTITNKTTGSVVVPSTAYTSPTVVPVFDGMQITLSTGASAPAPGDKFSIQPGNQNIFESLTDAINLLKTPAGTAAAKLDLNAGLMQANTNLDKALNNTLSARSRIGTSLKELDNLNSAGDSVGLIYKQELSGLQDLDYAKAITELNQNQVVLQAAQQSFIKTTSLSLFNYIN